MASSSLRTRWWAGACCSSAVGKALLGALGDAEGSSLLGRLELARVTPATITSRRALAADLAAGRARGWYVTRGENVADVMAVAAPVAINDETFAMAVAGPLQRMTRRLDRHAAALVAARQTLEAAG